MATKTIGTLGDYTSIADWGVYIKALGSLAANEVGILLDAVNYAYSANTDLDFNTVTLNGFTITLKADDGSHTSDVRHNGDFGNGARVETTVSFNGIYQPRNIIIEDFSVYNTQTVDGGARAFLSSSNAIFRRVIAKTDSSGANCDVFQATNNVSYEACRAVGGTVGFILSDDDCDNCTATGSDIGFLDDSHSGNARNNVAYNCTTGWSGTWAGTYSNNASEDSTHPTGVNNVILTVNPFDVDNYTPTEGSQLDGAGVNLSIALDASQTAYQPLPAIGAYEAPGTSIVITDVFWNPPTGWDYVVFDGVLISPESILFHDTGLHDGTDNASILSVSGAGWTPSEWIGFLIKNPTDGSEGIITANTSTTITATLADGAENDWDIGDIYEIVVDIGVNSQIVFETVSTLSGTVSLTTNGIPSIVGISGTHSFDYKIRDIADHKVSAINTVTVISEPAGDSPVVIHRRRINIRLGERT